MYYANQRLKLEEFGFTKSTPAKCEAHVVLAWGEGEEFVGSAAGQDDTQGQLRCAAEATASALMLAADQRITLEVLAVRAVEGFDTIIVVVSLTGIVDDQAERLVGSCLIRGDPARGAVLAVLSATNRLLGRVLAEVH
jgi:hypothetical protein